MQEAGTQEKVAHVWAIKMFSVAVCISSGADISCAGAGSQCAGVGFT